MKAPRATAADTIAPSRPPGPRHCWLCGIPGERLRADIHLAAHLCSRCWDLQPRGRNEWVRAAAALYVAVDPGPRHLWYGNGTRDGWLDRTARQHRITAWHDTSGAPVPLTPFDWIPADVLTAAAADLTALEADYQRSLIPPDREA
jgi:hypothetical protein